MKIVGSIYRDMVVSAACCLDNNKETVNNLNVFPVPDGDTGINMSLTISGVRSADYVAFEGTLGEAAQKAANLMLRGARGNSGVILSLFFRGIAKAWKDMESADCEEVIAGFKRGVAEAYKAVMNPMEGTILTVMRVMTETAEEAFSNGVITEVSALLPFMYKAADETLQRTPDMLPVLKQAGVVDSGGAGFLCVMEGMVKALEGNPVKAQEVKPAIAPAADFSSFSTEDIKYAYCTECIVTKSDKYKGEDTADALHQFIMKLGDSVVFVDDSEIIKLHVHTNKPGKVLTEALRYGSLYTVKIENMKHQHSNLSNEAVAAEAPEEIAEEPVSTGPVPIEKKYGFVTVCMGDGIRDLFTDLAADSIVSGGQTMNPSTEDLVTAIENTPAEIVFVLPNNKNIYMVSEQAARIVDSRKVVVIETVSVPEGMAAMLAFDESATEEENVEAMKEAVANVTTLSSTYAVRDTEIGETAIKAGETLGLYNGKIVSTSDDRVACLENLFEKVDGASIITILYGEGAGEEEANHVVELMQEKFPGVDVMVINGGQPVYSYIISIE